MTSSLTYAALPERLVALVRATGYAGFACVADEFVSGVLCEPSCHRLALLVWCCDRLTSTRHHHPPPPPPPTGSTDGSSQDQVAAVVQALVRFGLASDADEARQFVTHTLGRSQGGAASGRHFAAVWTLLLQLVAAAAADDGDSSSSSWDLWQEQKLLQQLSSEPQQLQRALYPEKLLAPAAGPATATMTTATTTAAAASSSTDSLLIPADLLKLKRVRGRAASTAGADAAATTTATVAPAAAAAVAAAPLRSVSDSLAELQARLRQCLLATAVPAAEQPDEQVEEAAGHCDTTAAQFIDGIHQPIVVSAEPCRQLCRQLNSPTATGAAGKICHWLDSNPPPQPPAETAAGDVLASHVASVAAMSRRLERLLDSVSTLAGGDRQLQLPEQLPEASVSTREWHRQLSQLAQQVQQL